MLKPYDPFTVTVTVKPHQVIEPGDVFIENGVHMKVIDIQKVWVDETVDNFHLDNFTPPKTVNDYRVSLTVREIPGKAVQE